MRLQFLLLPIYWYTPASAQNCHPFREFAVGNCTACATIDRTRGDIQMAVCEKRAANNSFECICGDFPDNRWVPLFRYYPQVEGDAKVCVNWWEMAPYLHTALTVPYVSVLLYAATHFFYIVARSEMCSCKRLKCTKINTSAFLGGALNLCMLAFVLILIGADSIIGNSGADHYGWLTFGLDVLFLCFLLIMFLALALFYTSIVDTVYPGEDMACMRHSISLSFWIPLSGSMLWYAVVFALIYWEIFGMDSIAIIVPSVLLALMALYGSVIMIIAHRKMLKVSLQTCVLRARLSVRMIS